MSMQVDESDESRYHHLLSTNNQASNEDAIELQKAIALREAALAELIAEVVDVRDLLESANEHRRWKRNVITHFHTILAPVRRLTREILVKIFLFTRHWEGDPNWVDEHLKPLPVGPRPGTSPLIITHICSYWKKVALGEPTLWATILSRRKPYHPSLRSTDPFRDFRLLTLARSFWSNHAIGHHGRSLAILWGRSDSASVAEAIYAPNQDSVVAGRVQSSPERFV